MESNIGSKQYNKRTLAEDNAALIKLNLEYNPNSPWFMEFNISKDNIARFLEQYPEDFIWFLFEREMKFHLKTAFDDYKNREKKNGTN